MKIIKIIKLIFLIIIIILVYLIYNLNNYKDITYLSLSDNNSYIKDKYGGLTYNYQEYLKIYLKNKNKLNKYYSYSKNDLTINDLINDIKLNKKINKIGIKSILRESKIVTLNIGNNDLVIENNINGPYLKEKTVNSVFKKYKKLLKEIHKYNSKIYVVSNKNKYKDLTDKLNDKIKAYLKNKEDIFIEEENEEKIFNKIKLYTEEEK